MKLKGERVAIDASFLVVLVIAGLCVFVVCRPSPKPREKFRQSDFSRTVAEGMRLWNLKTGVDSFRFDACRTEKLKMGAFRLGWFDVLCLDGLVLNLPLPKDAEDRRDDECRMMKNDGRGVMEAFAELLPQSLFEKAGVPAKSFAGIQIKGLQVNKVENKREVPVFAADGAKNHRQTLKLRNCRVFEPGRTNLVGVAYVVLQPAPALLWKDGMRRLDDLLPDFSETKGKEK